MPGTKKGKTHNRAAGLVLAAGASIRMGTPKQLLPLGSRLLLDLVLKQSLRSDLDLVVLVLGYKAEEIRSKLRYAKHGPSLRIVENTHYDRGISSSIRTGLSSVQGTHDHVMILLGDMPHITSGIINLVLSRYLESGLALGALRVRGRRSHPVIIGRPFFPALHRLRGDQGAKGLFLRHPDQVCLVEPAGEFNDMDVDTYEEYLELKKSMEMERKNRTGLPGKSG